MILEYIYIYIYIYILYIYIYIYNQNTGQQLKTIIQNLKPVKIRAITSVVLNEIFILNVEHYHLTNEYFIFRIINMEGD